VFGIARKRAGSFIIFYMLRALVLVLLTPVLPSALAQMNMAGHVMEMQDEIPPEKLPPPVRMTGIGNAHLQITASPEAQIWFDQGLNLLHDFWDYESARAFEQGVRVDPQCAMCYWGLYKSESFYHSTTQGLAGRALARAVELKERATEHERFYIDAADAREHRSRTPREVDVLRQLVAAYPDDLQARLFLGSAGGDTIGILESILRQDPENSAANHYYIHAVEGSDHPERALRSAEVLGRLAPASGHMVHMPGHIYFRLGDYARAGQSFAAALAVDQRYMRDQHVEPDNNWNYVHNLMYFIANLLEQGKFDEATRVSGEITSARGKLETTLYTYAARDSISRLDPRLPVALRVADFPLVLKLTGEAGSAQGLPNLEFLRLRLGDFAAGMQAVADRKLPEAEKFLSRFDTELQRMKEMPDTAPPKLPASAWPKLPVMSDALLHPLLETLSVMLLELRGSLRAAQGKIDDAKAIFADAAKQEKDLGYREPPIYIRPVGETEGAAMLAAQEWSAAKSAFERALKERPHSGFGLYGVALASERSGDRDGALRGYQDFLAAWKDADAALPQIAHAREFIAKK
jgi:tetratricopeptide (TPR) repeat protein